MGALAVLAPTAAAKDGDVEVAGTCTRATTSKLKLSDEDGAHRGRVRGRPESERRPLDGHPLPQRRARRQPFPGDARAERLVRGALRDAERRRGRPVRGAGRPRRGALLGAGVVRISGLVRSGSGPGRIAPWPSVPTSSRRSPRRRAPSARRSSCSTASRRSSTRTSWARACPGRADRRRRRLELLVPARARRRAVRPAAAAAAAAAAVGARHGARGAAPARARAARDPPAADRRRLRGRGRDRRAVLRDALPRRSRGHRASSRPASRGRASRRRLGEELVDALVEIHAADVRDPGLAAFARPAATSSARCAASRSCGRSTRPRDPGRRRGGRPRRDPAEPLPDTVVHGDYRLGNLMVERERPDRVEAVLDWEMGAIGDPRADLGYLLATYAEPGGEREPARRLAGHGARGFPTKRSSSRATSSAAAARSGPSAGSRHSRSGRPRCSARRSTAGSPGRAGCGGRARSGVRDGRAAHGRRRSRRARALARARRCPTSVGHRCRERFEVRHANIRAIRSLRDRAAAASLVGPPRLRAGGLERALRAEGASLDGRAEPAVRGGGGRPRAWAGARRRLRRRGGTPCGSRSAAGT